MEERLAVLDAIGGNQPWHCGSILNYGSICPGAGHGYQQQMFATKSGRDMNGTSGVIRL
jgi:hypothetical protein